jgi:acyl-coenzyme A synthetase/AMP-(fatty) acid ligase
MIHTHRSGLAYARLAVETHGITADDRLAGMPPLHFDMSTLELYAAPLAGASVVPISSVELRLPASFVSRAEAERTTIWYSVPFQYRQIEQRGALERRDLSPLRMVIYAGEPYPPGALVDLMTALPEVTVVNAYGPAETNVCTVHELAGPPTTDVPLGRPWGSVEVRIVDPTAQTTGRGEPEDVPLGEVGELWVSAPTVMAGYLGLPDLTEERLVPRDGDGDPWYRTGDLVRSDGDGRLWYLGRIDHQVKIRGVRLELEAVEAVVGSAPGVAHAVVGPSADGTHLAAAVVPIDGHDLDQRALTRFCAAQLASVAVPERFDLWASFPQGSSGKIDRRAVRADLAVAPPNEES